MPRLTEPVLCRNAFQSSKLDFLKLKDGDAFLKLKVPTKTGPIESNSFKFSEMGLFQHSPFSIHLFLQEVFILPRIQI